MTGEPWGDLTAGRLVSSRLILEPLRREHADELAALLADPALYSFIGGVPPSVAELHARVERQVRGRSPDGSALWLNWVARTRSRSQVVGTVQATVQAEGNGPVAVLAWTVGSAHQRQGLATEAAVVMSAWLRRHGVCRLRAHIHPGHTASMAVAAAVGLHPTDVIVDGERRWEAHGPFAAVTEQSPRP